MTIVDSRFVASSSAKLFSILTCRPCHWSSVFRDRIRVQQVLIAGQHPTTTAQLCSMEPRTQGIDIPALNHPDEKVTTAKEKQTNPTLNVTRIPALTRGESFSFMIAGIGII